MPVISYSKNTGEFSIATELRNVTMHVRPQMVVPCGDTVILITHLVGYYGDETPYFGDGKASLTKADRKYENKLKSHIRTGVKEELQVAGYSAERIDEINEQLFIDITMLCVAAYRAGTLGVMSCAFSPVGCNLLLESNKEDRIDKLHISERLIGRTVDSEMYNFFGRSSRRYML